MAASPSPLFAAIEVSWPWGGSADLTDPVQTVLAVVAIVVFAWVAVRLGRIFVAGLVRALFARETSEGTSRELAAVEIKKRMDTIEALADNVVRFFVVVIAGLMILGQLSFNIGPAIAGLGIVGIAVGLGTQSLVRDYLNGALILVENQYARGDVVTIAGVSGTVEDFTLRRTTLRDADGTVHTVPNSQVTIASNQTRVWARVNQDVQVVYGTDIDRAIEVVDGVGRQLASEPDWSPRILEAPRVERVAELAEFGVTLRVTGSVRAAEQWSVGGELRKRLLAALHEQGIEIPQPQKVILTRAPGPEGANRAAGEALGLVEAQETPESGGGTAPAQGG